MSETQKTISEWAESTFGYATRERSINRMIEEVEELKDADVNDIIKVADECADILITLYQVASVFGLNLQACVDHKMDVNRHRKWKIMGDGTGRHID